MSAPQPLQEHAFCNLRGLKAEVDPVPLVVSVESAGRALERAYRARGTIVTAPMPRRGRPPIVRGAD